MKYCPFCGAALLGNAASFCTECGKNIQNPPQTESKNTTNPPGDAGPASKLKRKREKPVQCPDIPQTETEMQDGGYDGYYDDVRPLDNGHERERMDPEMIKKIILIIGGTMLVITLSIALMLFL